MRRRAIAGTAGGASPTAAPSGADTPGAVVARRVAGHSRGPLAVAAVGLALALPLIAHASWHAYKEIVGD